MQERQCLPIINLVLHKRLLVNFLKKWSEIEGVERLQCDFIVIGSGPAGQKAAIQAAKLGKKVIVIEKDKEPGGAAGNTCLSRSL